MVLLEILIENENCCTKKILYFNCIFFKNVPQL